MFRYQLSVNNLKPHLDTAGQEQNLLGLHFGFSFFVSPDHNLVQRAFFLLQTIP
ncbi:hypothetical protein THIOM_000926 [Candidatus Thiomargarita nelsonii]|uniref:Uncharacterized protein n=1 Tax=Candidatus Thiomargarita nelsonii TaxID=1003181 RepID=A0A176S5L1_9GAMM|nr:hypothetical protein THIOM_000926 [Candidatus Thiomargarita nelsonii]